MLTPLQLSLLIHYDVSPCTFKPESEVADDAARMFMNEGMLRPSGRLYTTTEKGKFFIEYLLSTPFPQISFNITRTPTIITK